MRFSIIIIFPFLNNFINCIFDLAPLYCIMKIDIDKFDMRKQLSLLKAVGIPYRVKRQIIQYGPMVMISWKI